VALSASWNRQEAIASTITVAINSTNGSSNTAPTITDDARALGIHIFANLPLSSVSKDHGEAAPRSSRDRTL
jgi:hypothetical protein